MAGTELDITDRKQLAEKLRLSAAKSSGIISISADAIISIDESQRITLFNGLCALLTQIPLDRGRPYLLQSVLETRQ